MAQERMHGVWGSRWTFIMAATGSAVGLGNIWKFPYITGENGGGAFVLMYLVCICIIGIPIMLAEVFLGRHGRLSPVNSMRKAVKDAGANNAWAAIGWVGILCGLMIMSFYSVVAGWAVKYVFVAGSGQFSGQEASYVGEFFNNFLSNPGEILVWHTLFSFITAAVVATGVNKGLAMVANVLMPMLVIMLGLLLVYGIFNGDFATSVSFLFSPKFEDLSGQSLLIAMGHAFFTLSLGMGAIMAYGAYMPDHAKVAPTVITVGVLDTVIALVAGLVIFPIVFANGLEPSEGPGLMFVSLPVAFASMPLGELFGGLFFVLIMIAAWSSAVSLIEPAIAWLVETRKMNRVVATFTAAFGAWFVGVFAALSFNVLADFKPFFLLGKTPFDFLDFMTSQLLLPLGGMFIALFVGWRMTRKAVENEMDAEGHPLFDIWMWLLKYLSPVLVIVVFVTTLYRSIVG